MSVNQMRTQQGPSPLGIVSICLHTLQIIIKKREKLQCAVFFPSSLDLMLGAYWHLHQCIDFLHLCAVRLWPGGQQTRLPVPTGTPTAGLYHPALFARSHLDRHPAHLHPWVLVHHALLLYLCIIFFLTLSSGTLSLLICIAGYSDTFFSFPQHSPSPWLDVYFQYSLSHSLNPDINVDLPVDCRSWLNQPATPVILRERERGVDRDYCYTDWTIFTLNQWQTRLCSLSQLRNLTHQWNPFQL